MVSCVVLITLCAAVTCTKHQKSASHSLRHRSSDRGSHSPKNDRSPYSASPYKNSRPLDSYPNADDKDGMVFVLFANPGKQTEKAYPYGIQPTSDKLNDVTNDQFEQYASVKPREMDNLIDGYGYPRNPLNEASSSHNNHFPYQIKDVVASNPTYSSYSEASDKTSNLYEMDRLNPSPLSTYLQYVAQEHMPSPYMNFRNVPIDLTYLSYEEPNPGNASKVVPQWSLFPEKVEYIIRVLKKNMEMTSSSNVKLQFAVMQQYPPWIHYTLLLTVCLDLINDVVSKGEDAYELDFDQTIIESVNKVTANPQEVAEKIKLKLDLASDSIAPILRYISNVIQSEVCFIAVECDTMIEHALTQTSNLRLKLQAILLQATINLADIFMNQHAEAFEQAAKEHRAFEYVFSVDSKELAPLVAAGYTVKMIRKYLNPTDTSVPFKW